jgi:tetratricopeptide (TPR) repeat protein
LIIAIAKISETPVAERYLYIPSIALSLGLSAAFCVFLRKKGLRAIVICFASLIIGLYSAGTLRRVMVWTDNVRLWTNATQKAPNQGLPWTELGMAYIVREKLDEALSCFHKAAKAKYDREGRSIAYSNIAMIHAKRHEWDTAKLFFQEAIRERETYPIPHYGLGLLYLEAIKQAKSIEEAMKVGRKAEKKFQDAVLMNPNYVKALWGLTKSQMTLGSLAERAGKSGLAVTQYFSAIGTFNDLLQVDPGFVSAHPRKTATVKRLQNRLEEKGIKK